MISTNQKLWETKSASAASRDSTADQISTCARSPILSARSPTSGAVTTRTNIGTARMMPISKSLSDNVLSQTGKYGMAKPLTTSGAQKSKAIRTTK